MPLSNQKCDIQPSPSNLHPNEYNQELHYYPLLVKLDKYAGSGNTLNDLSNRVFIPNETDYSNIQVFKINTRKNESKILTKDRLCQFKCRFDEKNAILMNGGITINVSVSVRNIIYLKKLYLKSCYM